MKQKQMQSGHHRCKQGNTASRVSASPNPQDIIQLLAANLVTQLSMSSIVFLHVEKLDFWCYRNPCMTNLGTLLPPAVLTSACNV